MNTAIYDIRDRRGEASTGIARRSRRAGGGLLLSVVFTILVLSVSAGPVTAAPTPPAHGRATPRKSSVEMVFTGNTVVGSSSLRSLCSVSGDLTEEEMSARVSQRALAAYRNLGYLDAAVEITQVSKTASGSRLLVNVREGQPTTIGSFKCVGNRLCPSAELIATCGLREGMILTGDLLDGALEKIVSHLADRGFPFASAKVGDFNLEERSVGFAFIVDEGPLCTVGSVALDNSGALSSRALTKAMGVKLGETYSEKTIRRGVGTLKKTALFSEVGEPLVEMSAEGGKPSGAQSDAQNVRISIPVQEKKTTAVAGAIGFRGRTNEVTGGLSLSLLNIARTGRSAKAGWEATGRNVSSFHLSYAEPWVMSLPFTSAISFDQVVRDTVYARTSVGAVLRVPLTSLVSGEIGATFEKALNTEGFRTRTSRLAWLGGVELSSGGSSWSSENSFLATLEGTRGDKRITYISESRTDKEVFSTLVGRILLQRRLKRGQIALVDAKASAILEGKQFATQDELFALGGKRTLRGYSERQFLAPTVGSIQFEYGLTVGDDGGRVFGFLDCGYASTEATSTAARFHTGYGIGLRVPSPIGLAGIDFGLPTGESLGSGKIHVGLEGAF